MNLHYDYTIKVYKLKPLSGSVRHYVATATADATIQPLGKERGGIQEGQYGAKFIGYCDDTVPVQETDRVKDQNGHYYVVVNVTLRDYGAFPYKELILQKAGA